MITDSKVVALSILHEWRFRFVFGVRISIVCSKGTQYRKVILFPEVDPSIDKSDISYLGL